ncbi:MAG: citrate (Si)-synthase [Gammaproteobacteria bacterium]|nr:MAG: citrate (Si)-synthase [Gammaproteobacteria bacterium]RTZ59779.1 MAG: citrate (Si)-synthase [Gammaproteobacteria bacterium]
MSSQKTVTVTDNQTGKSLQLPLIEGTHGPAAMDISGLYRNTGYFTYDQGFVSTASCHSAITFIDGEKGQLLYRGYPIEQLAEKCSFMEVAWLLLNGELPTEQELLQFEDKLTDYSSVNESLKNFISGFYHDAHPMAVLVGVVGSLSSFYPMDASNMTAADAQIAAMQMIAKMPVIAAASYKHSVGGPFIYPREWLSYTGNMLNMMFSTPARRYEIDPVAEKALDMIFILHADHEQNASTSTVRLAGSSGANPFACISAGIASLWGPAHGGANEAVLNMLEDIGDVKNIPQFMARAKDRNDPFRLMGFGHRVYKNYDPRAKLIRKMCHEVLEKMGDSNDPTFELALRLEEETQKDEYFIERKLYPNVDFYSGIIYRALGIPTNMFTVMFAIARTAGWAAQWKEMLADPNHRIGRPRQVYNGPAKRDVPRPR